MLAALKALLTLGPLLLQAFNKYMDAQKASKEAATAKAIEAERERVQAKIDAAFDAPPGDKPHA
jgi:hypothetical protein